MRSLKSNKVFVSVYQALRSSEVNREAHERAKELLKREGVSFQVVKGVWKGTEELILLLSATNVVEHNANLLVASNLARLYSQESILEVGNDDAAFLHYPDGSSQAIGLFRETTRDYAELKESYTYEPVTGTYWVTE